VIRWRDKTASKVVAVFVASAPEAATALRHLIRGGVRLPIYLYSLEPPSANVLAICARVRVNGSALRLFSEAQADLWPHWVALGIASWNRKPGARLLKAAPFFFPPFRVLLMNENGDCFPGLPGAVWTHFSRRIVNAARAATSRVGRVMRSLLAYPLEITAQLYSPVVRFVFSRMHGSKTLVVAARHNCEAGAVLIQNVNGEWRLDKITEILRTTKSRWVVFQEEGSEVGWWDDMLPLFADPSTFAVTRQSAFRGWQKLLLPTAPFQRLQSGEATQVFAPISKQIVVDREKLLALGLPRLKSAPASWCLLFWKAAAAGWRSYSVGGVAPVHELPSMPAVEAQFVHALMRNPALARLKPKKPLLARGNIARRGRGANGFRGLPRILVLSPYLPYPLSHGGAVRMFSLCRALSARFDFVLACFREDDNPDYDRLHEIFRDVYVVGIDEMHHNASWPTQVSGYESASMRALLPEICSELRIDLLQVEYTQMAAYRETVPHLPAILVEHDVTFSLYRQLAEREKTAAAEREYKSWLRFESDRLLAFDTIWTMSELDREQVISAGGAPDRTVVVPNGVDLERFSSAGETWTAGEILYVGSFRHRPSYLGFEELCWSIMPLVWRTRPEARLRVVAGPNHERYWTGSMEIDSRITVQGFVQDVALLYRKCALAVVPLPVSAGTNIKLMEALASERAVVTTPVGCAGLSLCDGVDATIRELGPGFAEAICELLENPMKRQVLATQGRRVAEQRFCWNSIADRAAISYEALLKPGISGSARCESGGD